MGLLENNSMNPILTSPRVIQLLLQTSWAYKGVKINRARNECHLLPCKMSFIFDMLAGITAFLHELKKAFHACVWRVGATT